MVVHDPDHTALFEEVGATTIQNPQRLIAEYLFRAVVRPSIVDYMPVGGDAEVFEITVNENAPLTGKTIRDAAEEGLLGEDRLIVAAEQRDEDEPIPLRGNTALSPGDLVTVYSDAGATSEITDLFGHYED